MSQCKELVSKMKQIGVRFVQEEDGVGVVEIILILVILVGLVAVFGDEVNKVVTKALRSFSSKAGKVY